MIRSASPSGVRIFVWAALAIALPVLGCSVQEGGDAGSTANASDSKRAARLAPDFTLPDLQGQNVSLSDLNGKTVVLDFWATWCLPCIYQIPVLNEFWNAHREAGDVAVIGVAVDTEGAEIVAPWVAEHGVEYRIVIGDESLARKFGAMGFPTLAIITPDGHIDSLHVGLIELEKLEDLVAAVVAGRI
jgi:peroxiredoxin